MEREACMYTCIYIYKVKEIIWEIKICVDVMKKIRGFFEKELLRKFF